MLSVFAAKNESPSFYRYAVELKATNELIGSVSAEIPNDSDEVCEIGFIIGRRYQKRGYATEAAEAVIHHMFMDVGVNRVEGYHAADNIAPGRVLQKLGMTHEGLLKEKYRFKDGFRDANIFAVTKREWISRYLPRLFDFMQIIPRDFTAGNIKLVLSSHYEGDNTRGLVPSYRFDIRNRSADIILGAIDLRLGFNGNIYYGGHIGYSVKEDYRGMGIAPAACLMVLKLASLHGFRHVIITNNYTNSSSKRVCEKVGAKFIRIAKIPEWHDLYAEGQRFLNIFEVKL
ncbi:hypothetical protein FACS1894219_01510 [Clostridia bacterium]|nr:hypothetical protein FACS1894219_01510 [Clostridia bacterium]